ncbi:hypothetical protein RJ641_033859, partial [Dillenia turbinata]
MTGLITHSNWDSDTDAPDFVEVLSQSSTPSSMGTTRSIVISVVFIMCSFANCNANRKELRMKDLNHDLQLAHSIQLNKIDPSRVVQLYWQPRVFLYRGFLSDEECDNLISLAKGMKNNQGIHGGTKRLLLGLDVPANIEKKKKSILFSSVVLMP